MELFDKVYSNGMRVIAVKSDYYRSIRLELIVKGGPVYESKQNNGISHFVEHLLFEGTKKYPDKDQIDEKFERLGASYNGYTMKSLVGFTLYVPDTELEFSLDYLYEIMFNALLDKKSVAHERKIILDEIHNRYNGPYKRYGDFWDKVRYKNEKPLKIGGEKSSVKSIKQDDLRDWYQKICAPNNMTLGIVGNIDFKELERILDATFGEVKPINNPLTMDDYRDIEYSERAVKTQLEPKEKSCLGNISFPTFMLSPDNYRERIALGIVSNLLTNTSFGLLHKKLRKELAMLYSIRSSYGFGKKAPGLFEIDFETAGSNMAPVYEIIFEELRRFLKTGADKSKFELSKEGTINYLKMGSDSIASSLDWVVSKAIWEKKVYTIDEVIDIVQSVDIDLVNHVAHLVLREDQMNVISRVDKKDVAKSIDRLNFSLISE